MVKPTVELHAVVVKTHPIYFYLAIKSENSQPITRLFVVDFLRFVQLNEHRR